MEPVGSLAVGGHRLGLEGQRQRSPAVGSGDVGSNGTLIDDALGSEGLRHIEVMTIVDGDGVGLRAIDEVAHLAGKALQGRG